MPTPASFHVNWRDSYTRPIVKELDMLALSRRIGESVVLEVDGTIIEVILVQTKGASARLIFDAPNKVRIFRKEIYEKDGFDPNKDPKRQKP